MSRQPLNSSEQSFYDKHRLYKFIGITQRSTSDHITSMLNRESAVKTTMLKRNNQENQDVAARLNYIMHEVEKEKIAMLELIKRQNKDLADVHRLFTIARSIFSNEAIRDAYDKVGDTPDIPQLPPGHHQYYPHPQELPPQRRKTPDPPRPTPAHDSYLVQSPEVRRRRRRRQQDEYPGTILAQPR